MDTTGRDKAREAAKQRQKQPNKNARLSNMQGRQGTAQGNSLSFFTEEADGMKLSPYTVMVLCLVYIGVIVLLHIFSKVKGGAASKVVPDPVPE